MNVVAIIPALDEEASIGAVVRALPRHLVTEILVIDNGSTDRTAEIAADAGAVVVREPRKGYGYACQAGADVRPYADAYVFLDGDGSDPPQRLPDLLAALDEQTLVLGVRRGDVEAGAMLWHQRLGNVEMSSLIGLLTGRHVADLPSFKAINGALFRSLDLKQMTHGWTPELITKAACRGARIIEVETGYRRRLGQSKVSGTLSGSAKAAYRMNAAIIQAWLEERRHRAGKPSAANI